MIQIFTVHLVSWSPLLKLHSITMCFEFNIFSITWMTMKLFVLANAGCFQNGNPLQTSNTRLRKLWKNFLMQAVCTGVWSTSKHSSKLWQGVLRYLLEKPWQILGKTFEVEFSFKEIGWLRFIAYYQTKKSTVDTGTCPERKWCSKTSKILRKTFPKLFLRYETNRPTDQNFRLQQK